MRQVVLGVVATPFGPAHLAAATDGVVALELRTVQAAFEAAVRRSLAAGEVIEDVAAASGPAARLWRQAADEVRAFTGGARTMFDVPIELRVRSAWDRRVLDGVRTIPFGAVTSYGRLARLIGAPGAARAVGAAVGRNPIGLLVPCHRVVAGDGSLGGYGGGRLGDRRESLELKRRLLAREGVRLPVRTLYGPPPAARLRGA